MNASEIPADPHRDPVEAVKLMVEHGSLPQVGGIKPGVTENATENQLDRSRRRLVPQRPCPGHPCQPKISSMISAPRVSAGTI